MASDNLITTNSGLQYTTTSEGYGASPEPGQTVEVFYRGTLEDGTEFDSSFDPAQGRNIPFTFTLGTGSVIAGWEEGIDLMEVGETTTFMIPPDLAYGNQSVGSIPPNSTLTFEVVLLRIIAEDNVAPALTGFDIDNSSYQANQNVNITTSVSDQNGYSDVALVELYLVDQNTGGFALVGGVDGFEQVSNSNDTAQGSYSLSLAGIPAGDYQLVPNALDQQGYFSNANFDLAKTFSVANSAPSQLQFNFDAGNYTSADTLTISDAWIEEYNGSGDLSSIDFWLQLPDGSWQDLEDVTEFQTWSEGAQWSSFEYSLDLGDYTTNGTHTLWGRGYDQDGAESNDFTKTFTIGDGGNSGGNTNNQLTYRLDAQVYSSNTTLRLAEAWVYNPGGSDEVTLVDFWLKPENGEWQDIGDATSFTSWSDDERWASFDYELDISGFGTSNQTLWAQAYSDDGTISNPVEVQFRVEAAPSQLQLSVDDQISNTLSLNSGWVYHADGSQALDLIDVWLLPQGGEWQDVEDITTFEAWSGDSRWSSFDYGLDMSGYGSNSFTLWMQAYDTDGQASLAVTEDFQLV